MEIKNNSLETYRSRMEGADAAFRSREAGTARAGSAPASVSHGDRVSVSRDAMLRTEAFSVAMSASDIRREKVDSIKEELASGRYKIDNRRIAGRLVQSEIGLFRR